MEESESTIETIIEELELDTTIHEELIQEVADVYNHYCHKLKSGSVDEENLQRIAGYLTIAYMVRRLSARKLPLNKEERSKYVPKNKEAEE